MVRGQLKPFLGTTALRPLLDGSSGWVVHDDDHAYLLILLGKSLTHIF
jgi:hypothetical protein